MNIKEALKQGSCKKGDTNFSYAKLGLSDEVFERVASSVETFIKDEESLAAWVSDPKTLELLQSYQSSNDKIRTELNAKIKTIEGERDALKLKLDGKQTPEPDPKKDPEPAPTPDIAAIVQSAVAAAITPLQEKLNGFETLQAQKAVVASLDAFKDSWDYAKGYPEECADAYERTMEIYDAVGKTWSEEDLKTNFKNKFGKLVAKKGVDINKPFENKHTDTPVDFSKEVDLLRSSGIDLPE